MRWNPLLPRVDRIKADTYPIKARLIYDLNRYNDRSFKND